MKGDLFINAGTQLILRGAANAGNPAIWNYLFQQNTVHSNFSVLNATHGTPTPPSHSPHSLCHPLIHPPSLTHTLTHTLIN